MFGTRNREEETMAKSTQPKASKRRARKGSTQPGAVAKAFRPRRKSRFTQPK